VPALPWLVDLEDLRAFVAVADSGSFLAAANALRVPRATVRRRVQALEVRAGVALLDASPRGVVLTDAGNALAAQGRRMMQEMRAVLASVRDLGQAPRGTLRVVLPVGLPPLAVARLFGVVRSSYPELAFHVRMSNDPTHEPLDDVDLAVHFDDDAPGPSWVSFPIVRIRRWLLASPDYLARRGRPAALEDLHAHELLAWQAPGDDPLAWPTRGGGVLHVRPTIVSPDVHLVRLACAAGQGIAYIADGMLPEITGAEPLVPVLEDLIGSELTLRVSVPAALADVPRVRVVIDHARAFVQV
jgi:DNA-binding transcriptional LysR family regulator